ncbi:tetratricopeptide repeat protein [Flavobacterium chuncheonense]|uniref:Tetratricopeptide repeat protein n=1 Tax=Flavobacterium chuncheonense TaxID=2026653 RepID=A0ABW5YPK3_9FLAO
MLKTFLYTALLITAFSFAQNERLAFDYMDNGEYEKAANIFEEVYKTKKQLYFSELLVCYQQLEQYDKALQFIADRKKKMNVPTMLVEEGYIYQLQKKQVEADKKYEESLEAIHDNPNYAYSLGSAFEKKVLLDWALKAYDLGQKENPNLNFDYQVALLQGQMGNLPGMIDKLLDYAYFKPESTGVVQNYLTRFIEDEASESFNNDLKKALLIRTQKNPDSYWNQFLSWYYVQHKDYGKAFIQEKAIYKRDPDSFQNIVALAQLAVADNQEETATNILQFVLDNTSDTGLQINAHHYLFKMRIAKADKAEYKTIKEELQLMIKKYGVSPYTIDLQLLLAHFEAFNLNNPSEAIAGLNTTLALPLNIRDQSKVKMELADIMLYDEKFNQAILYYAQIEENLKNDVMAHEASMKMAKANYYKKDFDWALQQVKVLKQSSSLLIANDALELFLLISDNSVQDSTKVALTAFSNADFKLFQNKKDEALKEFLELLEKNKGDDIEDEAIMKIGTIYQQKTDYDKALYYYDKILTDHKESVYTDEALYYSAEIYRKFLEDTDKAKPLYEKMIFEHPDSIYFTEARKQYRLLRGDSNL